MIAPAIKAALLKKPPGTHLVSPEKLNPEPVQEKSVPTFSLQCKSSKICFRQGGESEADAYCKNWNQITYFVR